MKPGALIFSLNLPIGRKWTISRIEQQLMKGQIWTWIYLRNNFSSMNFLVGSLVYIRPFPTNDFRNTHREYRIYEVGNDNEIEKDMLRKEKNLMKRALRVLNKI